MKNYALKIDESWKENQIVLRGINYFEEYLGYFIKKETVYSRFREGKSGWSFRTDELTTIRLLVLDYLVKNFTLKEIYIIFYANQSDFEIKDGRDARKCAIQAINEDDSLTIHEAKRLKRKVWDMNPILFGLVLNLVWVSDLFWDEEKNEEFYPKFFNE